MSVQKLFFGEYSAKETVVRLSYVIGIIANIVYLLIGFFLYFLASVGFYIDIVPLLFTLFILPIIGLISALISKKAKNPLVKKICYTIFLLAVFSPIIIAYIADYLGII